MKVYVITMTSWNCYDNHGHVSVVDVKYTEASAKKYCDDMNAKRGGSAYAPEYDYEEMDVTE